MCLSTKLLTKIFVSERERERARENVGTRQRKYGIKIFINCGLQQILCGRLNEERKLAEHVAIMGNKGKT